MKRLLIALALLLGLPACALAQCNGIFPSGTVCGNPVGTPNIPGPLPLSSFALAPGGVSGNVQTNNGSGGLAGITNTTLANDVLNGIPTASGCGGTANFVRADGTCAAVNTGVNSASDLMQNGTLGATVAGNNLTVSLLTAAGATPSVGSPVTICFRNATIATGDYTCLSQTAGKTITLNAGSTLGVPNNTPFHIWIGAFNDAGTLRFGAFQSAASGQIFPIDIYNVKSTTVCTACSTATSAGVWYTGGASLTSTAFRLIGVLEWSSGLATSGTYTSAPTKIQLYTPGVPLPGTPVQSVTNNYNEGSNLSSVTHTNTVIDGIGGTGTSRLQVGMNVTGTNIAANTVIASITSSTAITVNNATTGSATNNLTYQWGVATSSTTFSNTAMTAGMTLSSAAHSVLINYCMDIFSTTGVLATVAIVRGGVQVMPLMPGTFSSAGSAAGVTCGGGSELPASVGPLAWTAQIKASGASVTPLDTNGGGFITATEIAQ